MRRIVSIDYETHLLQPGILAPPIVCGAVAEWGEYRIVSARFLPKEECCAELRRLLLDDNVLICGANFAYDAGVAAAADPSLLPLLFKAYRDGRIHDLLIGQALDAIFHGHLYKEPSGMPLLNQKGRQTDRYSLDICVRLCLKRADAKDNDFYKLRYAILERIPYSCWPAEALQYVVDDAMNGAEVTAYQLGRHPQCPKTETGVAKAFENQQDMAAQAETDWALHLGAVWGLRTDQSRIEIIEKIADKMHDEYVERFMKVGYLRAPRPEYQEGGQKFGKVDPEAGKKDTAPVARAVALAYGASGVCKKCEGTSYVKRYKDVPCRGLKHKGRMQGCLGAACTVCSGCGVISKPTGEVLCDECGASGFGNITNVPPTDSGRISTSRDTLMESGNDDLADFGDNQQEKVRGTYLPYLRQGVRYPITLEPHVLKETGRTSYSGPIQLFPRGALGVSQEGLWVPTLRECFTVLPGRVLGSSDYPGGELCALAQVCLWVVGKSRMADIINESGDPGSLHTLFGARMIGTTPEDLAARVKAKDKAAKLARQNAKPCFHPDTEILTRTGWKRIADLTMDDEVAAALPVAGKVKVEIEWQRPLALTRRTFNELVHFKSQSVRLRVTPEHRMLFFTKGCWAVVPAEGLLQGPVKASRMGSGEWMLTDAPLLGGEDVQVTRHGYDGDVVCLSVPSSFVVVRDGGVPVVVGQCNFGFGGGMGAPKFVLTNRKESVGSTDAPNGRRYHGLRFCISVGGAQECGTVMATEWGKRKRQIPPTCKACIEIVEQYLRPLWFKTFPEVEELHRFVQNWLSEQHSVPAFGPWFSRRGTPHRVRGFDDVGASFSAAANSTFQAYIADIAKDALRRVTREAYLDEDSVLFKGNVRIPSFQHDELLTDGLEEMAHLWGPRVGQLMHEAYNDWIPDVRIKGVDTALMRFWSKSAEELYSDDGRLLVWEPKIGK